MTPKPEYPQRDRFFANRFIRALETSDAPQELGPEICWLLSVVVMQEDDKRYQGAVTYWNDQLISKCGVRSYNRLNRIRAKAVEFGWLHYEPGGKGIPGKYWVTVPTHYDFPLQNGGTNTNKPVFPSKMDGQPVRETKHKPQPFFPIPIPIDSSQPTGNELTDFEFCTKKKNESWKLPKPLYKQLTEAYPQTDVDAELRKAALWCTANPTRRKTKKGMPSFLQSWLSRSKPSSPAIEVDVHPSILREAISGKA